MMTITAVFLTAVALYYGAATVRHLPQALNATLTSISFPGTKQVGPFCTVWGCWVGVGGGVGTAHLHEAVCIHLFNDNDNDNDCIPLQHSSCICFIVHVR